MRANTLDAKALEIDGQGASGGNNPNLIINGNFDIWQRGTSFINLNGRCADRWTGVGTTNDYTQQSFTAGQTDVPNNPTYFIRCTMDGGSAGGIAQKIEDVRTGAGQDVTISFWAKSNSSITMSTNTLRQDFGSGGSTYVAISLPSLSLTTSWQKFVWTVTLPSISGKTIGTGSNLAFALRRDSTAYVLDLAQVKIEIGSVATPFERRNLAEELALCERYYEVGDASFTGRSPVAQVTWRVNTEFRTTKRTTPSVTFTSVTTSGVSTKTANNISATNFEYQFIITTTGNAVARDTWAADAEL